MSEALPEAFKTALKGNGMFAKFPLSEEQVIRLKTNHAIYMPLDGRLNIAGIPEVRIAELCSKIIAVLI
jgi:aromatic-amino-acid transaminase